MKHFFAIAMLGLLVACSSAKYQSNEPGNLPELSYRQMLEDYDTLVSYIRQTSPVIYFNKEIRGIDFDSYAEKHRNQLNEKTTTGEFLQVVEKTIHAAQDGHTSRLGTWQLNIMKKYWIPDGFVKIDSASMENSYTYNRYLKNILYTRLDLNLLYTSGEYYNLLPFSFKGQNYPASMKLVSCNDREIHPYVASLTETVSPLRWDRVNNRVYEETFYSYTENYKNDTLKLVFEAADNKKYELAFAKTDTVAFLQEKKWNNGYNSDTDSVITHYFDEQAVFYARLPMMVAEWGDTIRQRLESVISRNKVRAVVIDIRGNAGGSDRTYGNFLKKLVSDTLRQNIIVGRNFSPYNQTHFQLTRDSVNNGENFTFDVDVPTLKEPEMYYIRQSYDFVVPDSVMYPFSGKIYILQDRYIYSSASNLSSLAKNNSQLISIGQTPDLLGGLQADPIIMMLPHSKIIFRVEPQIDLTNITSVGDMFQNHVEYPVPYSIGYLNLRSTTKEDIYGKDFLFNRDPMFQKVLELENGE